MHSIDFYSGSKKKTQGGGAIPEKVGPPVTSKSGSASALFI